MRIPAAGDDHKCAIFGGLDSASGRVVHQINAHKDEDAFLPFLDALAHAFPTDEPLLVVLDTASYHKSHAVQEWWRAHTDQLQPFFLPA
jgi:DDE superfamily endonuclease